MNILELDSFNLADAVKFNDKLNPRIWDGQKMRPEVRAKLLEIAEDFKESLGLSDLDVEDITVSGSNAGFTYTPHSDIDLHLVVRMPEQCDEVYQELFNAKKYEYNNEHDIKIGGYDVELYVQPADQEHHSAGIYSIKNNDWIHIPRKVAATADDAVVKHKYELVKSAIESALKSKDINRMRQVWDKVKEMRRAGLAKNGELGPENLAFKMLRAQGDLGELKDTIRRARDAELSLAEQNREKKPFVYGFKSVEEDATLTPDGVNPTTCMFLNEKDTPNHTEIIFDFMKYAVHELGLHNVPTLKIKKDPQWSVIHKSFGRYRDDLGQIELAVGNRHIMDVLRTLAHELQHRKQDEREHMPPGAGATGSPYENEAHVVAGILMRNYADLHPEYFEDVPVSESASGYIPKNKKEAQDPRYAMALTVDIKPGQTGKEANKMALKTDRQGKPGLLMKTVNLRESEQGVVESKLYVKRLTSEQSLVEHAKLFSKNLKLDNVPRTALNHYSVVCSTIFARNKKSITESKHITDGNQVIQLIKRLDQFSQLPIKVGAKVAIINSQFQGDSIELWGFTTPKTISKIYKDPSDGSIKQFEFNNDPDDVWPRTENAEYNGQFLMYSAFFGDKKSAEHALTMITLQGSGDLNIRNHITEQGVAEATKYKSHGYGSTPLSQVPGEQEDDLGNQEATGPEFPPQMPAGTTKIDVSDLTDWYRLGMDISDMDDADPEDYNQGPPQTVIVFPSDEAEQGYLKQFKRLGLKTHDMDPDVKGGEDIYGKHLHKQLSKELREFKEQDLFEIKMSPSNLRAEAAKTGAMAGMEFEMIVPNVSVDEEPNYEPDYDQDQRSRSFSDIVNFFYDGDYNSRRDVVRLEEELQDQFGEWLEEQIDEAWASDGFDYLKDYIENNDYFDEDEATEEATNALQAEYGDDISPEDFQKMLDAIVKEKFDEFVQDQWDNQGRYYDDALDQFRDEQRQDIDESDWLHEHYPYMTDIQNNFDIAWPYYTDTNEGDGDMDIESVADDFSRAVGMKVNWSSSYHGGRREPDAYVVEPDGSLEPNDSNDGGLEFVSPPMPIDKMIDQLNKVKAWAGDYGCYTNRSTGLHINISVPDYDLDKLDYVKLALLLGDKYILDQYGRSSNTYAKSALGKVQDLIKRDPSKGKELLDKMRGHMEDLATKSIHSGSTDKYTSINTKSGYIEFRSPGGDWLDANFDKIENTLLRFTVALSAAMDPEAYREEYLKKLYKLLEPVAEEAKGLFGKGAKDTVKYFADYVAGKTPRAALRSFIKQAQLERKIARQKEAGVKLWWNVARDGQRMEVVATNEKDAKLTAAKEWGMVASDANLNSMTAKPLRPYDDAAGGPQVVAQQPAPPVYGIWDFNRGGFVDNRGQVGRDGQLIGGDTEDAARDAANRRGLSMGLDTGEYEIRRIPQQQPAQQGGGIYKIYDTRGGLIAGDEYGSDQEALERAKYWALRRTLDVVVKNAQGQEIGRVSNSGEITPAGQQSASQGRWGIWMTGENRFSRAPGQLDNSVLRRFPSREAAEQWIEQTRAQRPDMRTDIEVREIEPTQSAGGPREYEIFADTDPFTVVRSFYAADDQAAQAILDQYRRDHPGRYYRAHRAPVPGSTLDLQRQRAAAAQQAPQTPDQAQGGLIDVAGETPAAPGEFTGNWLILDPQGREIHRFGGIGNNQGDANDFAIRWLSRNPRHMQGGVTVVPEMA